MVSRSRSYRSSTRSRGSSNNSDVDPKEKIKDCCRKLVAFMCTQVGVGGLVVGYTLIGAVSFIEIETREKHPQIFKDVDYILNTSAKNVCSVILNVNTFNKTNFSLSVDKQLVYYQNAIVQKIKNGYDGRTPEEVWSFPAALMFSLSIITMIGYGNMVPKTKWGKGLSVIYAFFGIPLYILYFMNMGEVLAGCFRWVYTRLYECSTEKDESGPPKRIVVPSTACLWVIGGYVFTGSIMFSQWEHWDYLDSVYFCVTSLCKIGFGDLVPGANISASQSGNQTKLVINFVYMLIGLGLVAMCYNLMREEVRVKVQEIREDLSQCLEDTRTRLILCYNRCSNVQNIVDVKVGKIMATFKPAIPIRLTTIPGYKQRFNDVVYCYPVVHNEEQSAVIYFGGDIQDFTENMQEQKDNENYLKWNLEDTARILHSSFLNCHLLVVRPARMDNKIYSCFENFVPCINYGIPKHISNHFALAHLEKLLQNVSEIIKSMSFSEINAAAQLSKTALVRNESVSGRILSLDKNDDKYTVQLSANLEEEFKPKDLWWKNNLNLNTCKIHLLGFSKGCVVLNQFLYEFHHYKTTPANENSIKQLIDKISDMYWLDGGHSGSKNTWITNKQLLQTLSTLGIKIHIHVTPYQIEDEHRPWIKNEEKQFFDNLIQLKASVEQVVHFNDSERNLCSHFNVLLVFRQN